MVQITGIAAQLYVNDVIESAEYYRDVLGFSFDRFFGDPPVFVGVDRGEAKLLLKQAPESRKPLISNTAYPSPGGFTDVYIYCDDVMALADEFRARARRSSSSRSTGRSTTAANCTCATATAGCCASANCSTDGALRSRSIRIGLVMETEGVGRTPHVLLKVEG